jgi:hypothetical protein
VDPNHWSEKLECKVKSSAIYFVSVKGAEDGQRVHIRISSSAFKSKIGIGCWQVNHKLPELAEQLDVYPNQIQA